MASPGPFVIALGFWRIPVSDSYRLIILFLFQLRRIMSRLCSRSSPRMFSLFRPCATGDTTATDATVMFSFILRVLDSRHRSSRNPRIGA